MEVGTSTSQRAGRRLHVATAWRGYLMDPQPYDPTDRSSYRHWIKDHVRFADLDPLGHCNHAVISGFFESSRVALFEAAGHRLGEHGRSLSIVRLVIEFRREL